MSNKIPKTCVIEKDKKYLNRPSPPYKAGNCKNTIIVGNNGKRWISVPDKNGIYHWKQFKEMYQTSSPFEFYKQLPTAKPIKYDYIKIVKKLTNVRKELYKYNIFMPYVEWKKTTQFVDYAWEDAINILVNNPKIKKLIKSRQDKSKRKSKNPLDWISFVFYTPFVLYWSSILGTLFIQHNIRKEDKEIVKSIFKKHFGQKFKWEKSNKTMTIKLTKI